MDILSHALWTGATYKFVNTKRKRKFNVWWATFWGIFPDLFAFTIPFTWMFFGLISGRLHSTDIPHADSAEPPAAVLPLFQLASHLYQLSHSLIIFSLIFALTYYIWERPLWELGGWLLHILIDIPTHSYSFYPTPIFWPLSSVKFNGISWATPWFFFLNYAVLAVIYIALRVYKKKKINNPL